jgi:hypothetical protein
MEAMTQPSGSDQTAISCTWGSADEATSKSVFRMWGLYRVTEVGKEANTFYQTSFIQKASSDVDRRSAMLRNGSLSLGLGNSRVLHPAMLGYSSS